MNVGYCVSCRKRVVKPDGFNGSVRCPVCHDHELATVAKLADRLGYQPVLVEVSGRDVVQINGDVHLHDIEDLRFYGQEAGNAEAA